MNPSRCYPAGLGALALAFVIGLGSATAQVPATLRLYPNLESNVDRPLRYRPDAGDFVIENGTEFFNRSLYGGNTAFRVDGGDRPEFVLYLPGRGGNLRLGLRTAAGAKWLHTAERVEMRYRPGELLYEVRDPLLGPQGRLRLAVVATHASEGLIVRAEGEGLAAGVEFLWAFGGVTGQRGVRDGDIGTERVPISQYFQLRPEFCRGNTVVLGASGAVLNASAAQIALASPAGAQLALGDATRWDDPAALLAAPAGTTPTPELPLVVGHAPLPAQGPLFLGLQRQPRRTDDQAELSTYLKVKNETPGPAGTRPPAPPPATAPLTTEALPALFADTRRHFAALRSRVELDTPDPFLNAAAGALNVAADAVWDEPQRAIMHGAIAWRTKLLGWRGPYALDALGWFDRARANITYWAGRQNTSPIPETLPPPATATHLSRNEDALHSNGDLSHSHYDMNTVFIDAVFRHLLWTGDEAFAKQLWPVIERHLAWQRRLFRREFGPEKLPLYEAYAVIWASDDLQYSGGGAAHSSAYNHWHNRMAARLAPLAGADPAPYVREAEAIARGMRELLWVDGHFAEYKDFLGRQALHTAAAGWTFYHTMDAALVTPEEAAGLARYVAEHLPHLPVRGPGVPEGLETVATTNWMPYTWSLNNVVMSEAMHTALGLWQAERPAQAWRIAKGSLLASMFMGISPGNVGSMNTLDVYRRESQRDFADGSGVLSRTLIEGLFGVRPDVLAGELRLAPGFPAEWERARLKHPNLTFAYRRQGAVESLAVEPRFARPVALRLELPWRGQRAEITVNGQPVAGTPAGARLAIAAPAAPAFEVRVTWQGTPPADPEVSPAASRLRPASPALPAPQPHPATIAASACEPLDLTTHFNDRVTEIFRPGKYVSPRSPFTSLALPAQGIGYWAGHVNATAEIDDTGLRATAAAHAGRLPLPDGRVFATPGPGDAKNIVFTSQWDNYPREVAIALAGKARQLHLLMAGSTNAMQSRFDNGEVVVTYTDGSTERLALRNPETWWPIEQDYFIDDYQFRVDAPPPIRVDLKTGVVRVLQTDTFKGKGRTIPGGAATVLALALDPQKELRSFTVRTLANDVVIGLMAATLAR